MQGLMYEFLAYASGKPLSASKLLDEFCTGKGLCSQMCVGFKYYLRGQGVM